MIEQPDLPLDEIRLILQQAFDLAADRVQFLPLGLDQSSWAYRVDAGSQAYFLKVRTGSPRLTSVLLPGPLQAAGLAAVIPPLVARDGRPWHVSDGLTFFLCPYIEGVPGSARGMSQQNWRDLGAALMRLHGTPVPPELLQHVPREDFTPAQLPEVRQMLSALYQFDTDDPLKQELVECWNGHRTQISRLADRSESLANQLRKMVHEFVLCHADVHPANVLLDGDGRLYIVDWDDVMMAPRERDLVFVHGEAGPESLRSFYVGYGPASVNPLTLAYYRHTWCLADIGLFAADVLTSEKLGLETRRVSLGWFKRQFLSGGSVETALATALAV